MSVDDPLRTPVNSSTTNSRNEWWKSSGLFTLKPHTCTYHLTLTHITALTLTLYSPRFTLSRSGGLELSRPVPAKPAGTPSITQELHRASGQQRMDVVFDFIILIFRSPTSSFDLCCSLLFRPIIRRATRASPGPLTDTHSPGPHHRHALTHVLM